jgi:uncharacterized membrane protein YhaH (DUF805 family)
MIKFLSFYGRLGRLDYWRITLGCSVLIAVFWCLGIFATLSAGPAGAVLFAGVAPPLVASVAAAVRRLHDRGKSMWWWALFVMGPAGLQALSMGLDERFALLAALAALAGFGLGLWGLVEIGFRRGERGANRYGEDPMVANH